MEFHSFVEGLEKKNTVWDDTDLKEPFPLKSFQYPSVRNAWLIMGRENTKSLI